MSASRALPWIALLLAVLLAAPTAAASSAPTGEPLTADEVKRLFTGNTEVAVAMKRGVPTGREYRAYYREDGVFIVRERNGFLHGGAWFVDPLGRHCFRPGGKDKAKCDVIVREGNYYIRLRDGGRRGRFTVEPGNPFDL